MTSDLTEQGGHHRLMSGSRKSQRRRQLPCGSPGDVPVVGMVLDLENLLHDARQVSGEAVRAGLRQIMATIRALGTPRVAIGVCDWWLAKMLAPEAQRLGLRVYPGAMGPDRADAELLRRAAWDVPPSVDLLVIGSGDGAFRALAREQHELGRRVVVAGRPGGIARSLAAVADQVLVLDLEAQPAAA
jgi:hypothetical protein